MFTAVQYQNQVMGYAAQVEEYYLFYGTCHLKRSHLREVFPQYEFCFVRQVHGSRIVEASSVLQSADGHYTREKNKALIVQTADCLPVLLMKKDLICAVHAGWRGVAQQIVISAVQLYLTAQFLDVEVSIGPHISQAHFQVKDDVALQLKKSSDEGERWLTPTGYKKYTVSLMGLLKSQILSKIQIKTLHLFNKDTFSEKIFYSYRRNSENHTGQYSFIVRV